ncbi:uncharacterized protein PHALS_08117 [Plasmopara halstedii]|uniref:Uncharacterized protein n=1 Tax=Plasmopara halstedii TaxID=4781 RepID=A0A0P1B7L2_PLAHL|nr:uncharacterized protein PHALS_08117 [Plasmopara halstedii]CEG50405.1 hypothetical protein PHALS_08117 [Plasmopara halstedii]|eukprot:XP_024586774.1 hypothetical protein PHALS_08117 [Plasmopara halstedii]
MGTLCRQYRVACPPVEQQSFLGIARRILRQVGIAELKEELSDSPDWITNRSVQTIFRVDHVAGMAKESP